MKKGFTLIELLAVIIILAVIALIATPIILNIVDNAKQSSFISGIDGILISGRYYQLSNEEVGNLTFTLPQDNGLLGLNVNLNEGTMNVYQDGTNEIALYDSTNKWCGIKKRNDSTINVFKNVENCDIKYAKNLITNGYGEYENNKNFSQFTYDSVEKALVFKSDKYTILKSNEYIPIDPNKKYKISVEAKSDNPNAIYYIGIFEYDIDLNVIYNDQVMWTKDTLATLTKDLKNGDTEVYLDNVDNFDKVALKGFTFWNYQDSTGYQYPEFTYSRNTWRNLYELSNIDKVNNVIRLNEPWNKGTYVVGTKLSGISGGKSHNYGLHAGGMLTNNWQYFKNTMTGISYENNVNYQKFRYATKYIRFLILDNYSGLSNTTSYYRNIAIEEIN